MSLQQPGDTPRPRRTLLQQTTTTVVNFHQQRRRRRRPTTTTKQRETSRLYNLEMDVRELQQELHDLLEYRALLQTRATFAQRLRAMAAMRDARICTLGLLCNVDTRHVPLFPQREQEGSEVDTGTSLTSAHADSTGDGDAY